MMGAKAEFRDGSGNVTFNSETDITLVVLATLTITASGSVTVPNLDRGRLWYRSVVNALSTTDTIWVTATASGTTLTYTVNRNTAERTITLIVGIY